VRVSGVFTGVLPASLAFAVADADADAEISSVVVISTGRRPVVRRKLLSSCVSACVDVSSSVVAVICIGK
jgi:hypothetical protein